MENATKANTVFEDFVNLKNSVVSFIRFAVGDVVDMELHFRRHFHLKNALDCSSNGLGFGGEREREA